MALSFAARVAQAARTLFANGGDPASVRIALGQKEVVLDDRILGANTASFDLNLQGYRSLRLRYELYLPVSVPSTTLALRTSTDGTTFAAGGTDYYAGFDYTLGATPGGSAGAGSYGQLALIWQASQSTEIVVQGTFDIFAGASGKRFGWNGFVNGINSDAYIGQIGGRRQTAGAQSHIRLLLADGSANIGAGSRFTLIGLTPP